MSLGTGIFLAALVLAAVYLYSITRDRWNWKKVFKWFGGIVLLAILALACFFGWMFRQDKKVTPFTSLGGISLDESQADVKFKRGVPEVTCTEDEDKDWALWAYPIAIDQPAINNNAFIVTFKGGHVWSIWALGNIDAVGAPTLDGITKYTTLEAIKEKYGPESSMLPSDDGLSRVYSFKKYNLRVHFSKNQLDEYGIYNEKQPDDPFGKFKRKCSDDVKKEP